MLMRTVVGRECVAEARAVGSPSASLYQAGTQRAYALTHGSRGHARTQRSRDLQELLAEVVVQPAVQQRVRTRRRHAHHVTHGVRHSHGLLMALVGRKRVPDVDHKVEDVERQPAHAKDECDGIEQGVGPLHPLVVLGLPGAGG